jgi:hypothetical protein
MMERSRQRFWRSYHSQFRLNGEVSPVPRRAPSLVRRLEDRIVAGVQVLFITRAYSFSPVTVRRHTSGAYRPER